MKAMWTQIVRWVVFVGFMSFFTAVVLAMTDQHPLEAIRLKLRAWLAKDPEPGTSRSSDGPGV